MAKIEASDSSMRVWTSSGSGGVSNERSMIVPEAPISDRSLLVSATIVAWCFRCADVGTAVWICAR